MNPQVASFQRCKSGFQQCQAWVKLQLALCLLLLTILRLYRLPRPLHSPVSNSSCLLCQPLHASYCTVLLYFSRYCKIKIFLYFLCLLFMYYLCENCYKPIMKVKVTQSCPTLWDPMDYSPWNSPGQNTGVGSCSLLQGIFPNQALNPSLKQCRWILYHLSQQESPNLWQYGAIQPTVLAGYLG